MLRSMLCCALFVLALPTAGHTQDWVPSKWGAGDTLGSVNEITPDVVLNAVRLVTEGKRYNLGQITSRETPASGTRTFELFVFAAGADGLGAPIGTNEFNFFDDWMLTYMGVGSQIDGLGHATIGDVFYNGFRSKDFFRSDGLTKMGIEALPPIVTRGVVLDMVGYFKSIGSKAVINRGGVDMLAGGTVFNRAEIEGAAARQNLRFQQGDVILFHTGYMKMAELDGPASLASWPGVGVEGAVFLASQNPVAIGADTLGTEVQPAEIEGQFVPVHQELIVKRGIYILENMVTAELVEDQAWEFLFTLGAARFKGAVQMIINPVAVK